MRLFKVYILPFLLIAALWLLVRYFVVNQYEIGGKTIYAPLCVGDRVLVGKYPLVSLARGALVVYRHPKTGQISVGKVLALTGDSIWVNPKGQAHLRPTVKSSEEEALLIPGRCEPIDIDSVNARYFSYILSQYESRTTSITATGGILVNHRLTKRLHFAHNYCWIEGWGLISDDYIVGRIFCVSYSFNNGHFRKDRCFLRL